MRFRRRRRIRVQWLPQPGSHLDQNGVTIANALENPAPIEFFLGTTTGIPTTFAAPMVVDNPISETLTGAPLSVYQNLALNQTNEFGWRLRRIVADLHISALKVGTQTTAPPGVLVEAGIIVRRVEQGGGPAVAAAEQDVGALQNQSDPWVWRRSWALSNFTAISGADLRLAAVNQFPNANWRSGTKWSQAIDQKTNRRIGPEERLFLNVTAWEIPLDQTATGTTSTDDHVGVYFLMPYRVLGTVITSAGNRRNASR